GLPCRPFNTYLIQKCTAWSDRSTETYAGHLARFGTWLEEKDIAVEDISRDHVARYAHQLAQAENVRPRSAIAAIGLALRYLAWRDKSSPCDDQDLVSAVQLYKSAVTRLGILQKPVEEPIRFARHDEAESHHQTLSLKEEFGAHGKRNELMSRLMSECGLRVSEVVGLPVSSLPRNHDGAGKALLPIIGKGRKLRFVTPSARLLNELLAYVEIEREAVLAKLSARRKPTEVFLGRSGRALTTGHVQELFRKASARTGKHVHPHMLRHTFGTYDYLLNKDLVRTMKLMGHSNSDTTQQYIGTALLADQTDKYEEFLGRLVKEPK